ncbi:hypothetical protein LTR10_014155 [Elasticomyces elasticus]|uniref:C6 zinc finger domain-containing protein n=1 Tax=Exophiala sideris TaxID=1016849 RepID=A0ABR0J354_9EURO|nr:hypothetical protein LTR10_014155 [Elasticomyces elasticus]KAK5026562.1 hypothetical protein LTS07_007496 [Exophiala sideris]KAK5033698.1 hypothetical protein LTR13_006750 [Exophiala sideris]KAK5055521.1 hypothetical protein LTR69_008354 [Exophiala sideris]KAK5180097.1 hypothetical protein LTR44_007573 [Eurotiomycetes sp. CCFEE 6388]
MSMSTSLAISTTPSTPWATIDPLLRAVIAPQISHVEMNDLELIHHYSTTNSMAFTMIPGLFPLRRVDIAGRTPEYPYLLHGILAVSALHLQSTTDNMPNSKRLFYAQKASVHQQLALSSYIPTLNSINDRTCHFVFGFSAILAGLGFGYLCTPDRKVSANPEEFINGITTIFDLLLGTVAIANASSRWIKSCEPLVVPFKTILGRQDASIDIEVETALERLCSGVHLANALEAERNAAHAQTDISVIFISAIPDLHKAFRCIGRKEPDNFLGVIGWPAFVDNLYVSLVKQRHPAALVVLAYYGAALHALDHAWWLRGVGRHMVGAVSAIVQAKHMEVWQDLLQWPLDRVGETVHGTAPIIPLRSTTEMDMISPLSEAVTPFETAFIYTYANDFSEP